MPQLWTRPQALANPHCFQPVVWLGFVSRPPCSVCGPVSPPQIFSHSDEYHFSLTLLSFCYRVLMRANEVLAKCIHTQIKTHVHPLFFAALGSGSISRLFLAIKSLVLFSERLFYQPPWLFFSPRPSLSFAFQLGVWGSQTDPSKPSLFPWSISPSLSPLCFSFPGGSAFMPVCTDDLRYHQHPSKRIYSPPTLPGCSATPSCLNSHTGASGFLSPSADATGPARSGETLHFSAGGHGDCRSQHC